MAALTTNSPLRIPSFIPLSDASEQTGLSVAKLTSLVKTGRIAAAQLPSGEIVVSQQDTDNIIRKEDLPEYMMHAHLKGKGIGVAEAAEEFDIPKSTISRWAKKGYITRIGRDGRKVLLDAADVAYCVEVHQQRKAKRGCWLFNEDGTPYIPKQATATA